MAWSRGRAFAALVGLALAQGAVAVDLDAYIKRDRFIDVVLSPTGEYFAATIPYEDRTALAIVNRADNAVAGIFNPGRDNHAGEFRWVSDTRVVIQLEQKLGSRDEPWATGELFAINADGRGAELLVGYRVESTGPGTLIKPKKVEAVAAFPIDTMAEDDNHILINVWPLGVDDPYTRAEKLNVRSGRRMPVARSPVQNGEFHTDNSGQIRFVEGQGTDNASKLYYRVGTDWKLLNDENISGARHIPIGFSEDNQVAYIRKEQPTGPDAIVAWTPSSDNTKEVFRDKTADPLRIIHRNGTWIPVGVMVMDGRVRTEFFDPQSPEARMYRSLEAAFGGAVRVTSATRDGRTLLVQTWAGDNPGDFYVFDTEKKSAAHLVSRSEWIDPEKAAQVEPVSLTARDGVPLHGYLTRPKGTTAALPMVVMPHGGPFGLYDAWSYDRDAQMLASAGYAVLKINFRGSGNYGRRFEQLGAKQWGRTMQDDVTDATRWAIQQGHADGSRVCIYGASYGAYAALMGAAREPDLYRCAAGYVGVYDLPMMFIRGDTQDSRSGMTYLRDWIGDPKDVAAVSPVNLASQIKVPVFLAAGGEDKRAPQRHTERMEAALKRAGVPVESLYYKSEGHGFYTEEHQREYYTRLLAFLSRSLGGKTATGQSAQGKAAAGR